MNDDEQKIIFSKNLLKYLTKMNKSQKEVADAIEISPQTFNTWCQGIALPRMGKVQKLADYFHINKSDLLDENKSYDKEVSTDLDIRRIQRAREKMSEQERTKMMKVLEASFDDYFGEDFVDED